MINSSEANSVTGRESRDTPESGGGQANELDRRYRWPWWTQFLLALFGLLIGASLLIGLPIFGATIKVNEGANVTSVFVPFIAVLIALTTVTISGIFLFMTLRIDRGVQQAAQSEAKDIAIKEVKYYLTREHETFVEEVKEYKNRSSDLLSDFKTYILHMNENLNKIREENELNIEEKIKKFDHIIEIKQNIVDDNIKLIKEHIDEKQNDIKEQASLFLKRVELENGQLGARAASAEKEIDDRITRFRDMARTLEDQLRSVALRAIAEQEKQHKEDWDKAAQESQGRILKEENDSISRIHEQEETSLEQIREVETTGKKSLSRSVDESKEEIQHEFDSLKQKAESYVEEFRAEIEYLIDQKVEQKLRVRDNRLSRLFRRDDSS